MDDRPFIVAMVTNSWGSAELKIMIQGKSGIFLKFEQILRFWVKIWNQKSKITPHTKF